MKININEFNMDAAHQVEAPLDFTTLCSLLAEHQAATPTARLARDVATDPSDHAHPAVAILLASPGQAAAAGAHGSFHAAAAARFTSRVGNK